jgi:predicted permease
VFLDYFRITGAGVLQIFLLGAIGYFLVKKNIISQEGLGALSRTVIEVTLPLMIFCQLLQNFTFRLYSYWWVFPLISIAINLAGFIAGLLFCGAFRGQEQKLQFLSLTTFQNSGYLPLALVAALLSGDKLNVMFIYLFLLLAGFNLVMFSVGVHMLVFHKNREFELGSLFSPPVIATIVTLVLIYFNWQGFVPQVVFKPLEMVGNCTLPLAMFVVGGNLAQIRLVKINKKMVTLMTLAKLIILPAAGLWVVVVLKLPELIGLLIIMQLAMPPATLLSVITSHYKKEDIFISQGILFGHLISIITIPLFLSIYFTLTVVK